MISIPSPYTKRTYYVKGGSHGGASEAGEGVAGTVPAANSRDITPACRPFTLEGVKGWQERCQRSRRDGGRNGASTGAGDPPRGRGRLFMRLAKLHKRGRGRLLRFRFGFAVGSLAALLLAPRNSRNGAAFVRRWGRLFMRRESNQTRSSSTPGPARSRPPNASRSFHGETRPAGAGDGVHGVISALIGFAGDIRNYGGAG